MNAAQSSSHPTTSIFLDRDQLAQRWKTSISTLKRREKCGELVPTRLGGRIVRYSMKQILAIEEAGTAEA